MIELKIIGVDADEMKSQLLGLVSMIQQGEAAAAAEPAKPPTRKAKTDKVEPAAEVKVEPEVAEAKPSVFDDEPAKVITREDLVEAAMKYAQDKSETDLGELINRYSMTGKISGIPETSYAAALAELKA